MRRFRIASCSLLLSISGYVFAQSGVIAVPSGLLQDPYSAPPTLELIQHSPEAHPSRIWIRSTDEGLHIWGKVQTDEKDLHWPRQRSEMLTSDHIEVWLAAASDVSMPLVGWGNQFGATELSGPKDCSDRADSYSGDAATGVRNCEQWYSEQLRYREQFQRLFVRQWLIAGGEYPRTKHFFEDFATTAYANLKANFFDEDVPNTLEPKGSDGVVSEINVESNGHDRKRDAAGNPHEVYLLTGYNFHVFIPYTAFPPTQQLKLSDLWVMVDVFSATPPDHKMGAYSTSSAERQWGKPATFNHLRLESPRTFNITPCQYKPEEEDLYGNKYKVWFFPSLPKGKSDLKTTFVVLNPAHGYMYDPSGVSPLFSPYAHFWKTVKEGAFVCGPLLAYRKGDVMKYTEYSLDEKYLEVRTLPDGWRLIRSGPSTATHSPFGSGECGSCLDMGFNIFAVSPEGEISAALSIDADLSGQGSNPAAADLAISPDWRRITFYQEFETETKSTWTSTAYCLEGHAYKQCGESKQAKPPNPPYVEELRWDD